MNKIDEILKSLIPEVDYNPGILPDEDGYDGAQLHAHIERQQAIAEAKDQLQTLFDYVIGDNPPLLGRPSEMVMYDEGIRYEKDQQRQRINEVLGLEKS